jgi:murein DD-endopeptidase MepM/ murein hydrolase activator NlpD
MPEPKQENEEQCHLPGCSQTVQRQATGTAEPTHDPSIVHEVLRSPGQPLDSETRTFMNSRFGHDLSGVQVHTDEKAAESARAVNALAYTFGRDVVFGAGQYAPGTSKGKQLIAHELAHMLQQNPGPTLSRLAAGETKTETETAAAAGETTPAASTPSAVHPLRGEGTYKRRVGAGHQGVDIAANLGTKVVAVLAGTVESITTTCAVGVTTCGGGWGNNVLVDHGDEGKTRYAHLNSVSVRKGDSVTREQEIGTVGSTGHSTGNHLHLEWKDKSGAVIDPCQKIANLCPQQK